eukprot:CAMPEP_0178658282 /NCGR_PEP_ID=MMETSP0698-20121128/25892_1 /TAXON_ID=265572 /ORGANISM="Extubocellulus spinifer, Strain CCMP396" /LENGTH=40 /DNA_ID= /DNA_START= /DNA_END= /DNA_ORIENTATION=
MSISQQQQQQQLAVVLFPPSKEATEMRVAKASQNETEAEG